MTDLRPGPLTKGNSLDRFRRQRYFERGETPGPSSSGVWSS